MTSVCGWPNTRQSEPLSDFVDLRELLYVTKMEATSNGTLSIVRS